MKLKTVFHCVGYMFKSMWAFNKGLFVGEVLTAVLNGVIAPVNAYLIKILVDNISAKAFDTSLKIIAAVMLVNLLYGLVISKTKKETGILDDLFRNQLILDFYSKIADMDYEILYTPDMIQQKNMALKAIQSGYAMNYLRIMFSWVSAIITFISILYLLTSISVWVYVLILILIAVRIFTVMLDKKRKYRTTEELSRVNTEINYYMNVLSDEAYVNDIKMFSVSDWILNKYKKCMYSVQSLIRKLSAYVYRNDIIRDFLSCIETVLPYIYVTVQVIFYGMSFANFTLVTATLKSLTDSVSGITNNMVNMRENSAYVKNYIDFMQVGNKIAVPDKGIAVSEIRSVTPVFEFKNVGFVYPECERFTLRNINMKIEPGKFYVMVGENGAGKTTLVRLMCRLYDVSEGALLYMGTDVKDVEYKSYRNNIGVVFQDYKYYCFSIAENVAMNDYRDTPETEERILKALDEAGLGEKIASLPKGIHTQLGKIFDKDGIQLSGGELQKLALARVLFKDPSIVILDEPSSALDAFAEDELITTFNSALRGKTVIYISHRLSVACHADKVIFVKDGEIAGMDLHKALMEKLPDYKEMYETQAKHYE